MGLPRTPLPFPERKAGKEQAVICFLRCEATFSRSIIFINKIRRDTRPRYLSPSTSKYSSLVIE
jgi:hypothetical protein